ncbi:OmpA family protein [Daejeonella sp. H1SJ63]|jgi:chemotaxis protein MotB|uniref:OmpA family protein n=1 Tax=Daejeonella sp. H1SJ63 TaxID=3034145 RepID=UPI0023EBC0EA|nr:OmpA family protein [Daejeonella sp. H1SJ63]
MKNKSLLPVLLIAAVLAQSCISKKKYTTLQTSHSQLQTNYNLLQDTNRDLDQKLQKTQNNLSESQVRVRSVEEQLASERSNLESLQKALDKCLTSSSQGNVNISKLVDEINSSNKYIKQLVNAKNKSDSLNLVLTNNLTRSLTREEMSDVNVQVLKGVVYISLADNMLYRSGSYLISDRADKVLGKIAKIIKDYDNYEVLIEGNTDNVPISMPNIRNNWDLSALRASSVVQSLQNNYGVDPKRLTAGGRGEYNTIADNNTEAGKARNRRTQIIITPKLDQFMELIGKAPASSGE